MYRQANHLCKTNNPVSNLDNFLVEQLHNKDKEIHQIQDIQKEPMKFEKEFQ